MSIRRVGRDVKEKRCQSEEMFSESACYLHLGRVQKHVLDQNANASIL